MSLLTLWHQDKDQVVGKRLDQLIAFAGNGKLTDDGNTCRELRELLSAAPSALLARWKTEALELRYEGFGFVLQDLVNEVGNRLGFTVEAGRYRGRAGGDGHDGFWRSRDGHVLLIETKTSSSHRIELRKLAEGRRRFVNETRIESRLVSTLIVIAEEDTAELEAQVRGSRSAWEVRLLGVDALFKLLNIKESLDSEAVERQIREILVPQEFTRLDRIIDLVFATAEDVQPDEDSVDDEIDTDQGGAATYYLKIMPQLERHFKKSLVKRSRILWASPDDQLLVSCQGSRAHERSQKTFFWYGVKPSTAARLQSHPNSHCAYALGGAETVVLFPFKLLATHLDGFSKSMKSDGDIFHWHVKFRRSGNRLELLTQGESVGIDVSSYIGAMTKSCG